MYVYFTSTITYLYRIAVKEGFLGFSSHLISLNVVFYEEETS